MKNLNTNILLIIVACITLMSIETDVCAMGRKRSGDIAQQPETKKAKSDELLCLLCGETYPIRPMLDEHMRVKHLKVRCHRPGCTSYLETQQECEDHEKTHWKKCRICEQQFDSQAALSKHLRGHPKVCSVCSHVFKSPLDLHTHFKNDHLNTTPHLDNATPAIHHQTPQQIQQQVVAASILENAAAQIAFAQYNHWVNMALLMPTLPGTPPIDPYLWPLLTQPAAPLMLGHQALMAAPYPQPQREPCHAPSAHVPQPFAPAAEQDRQADDAARVLAGLSQHYEEKE